MTYNCINCISRRIDQLKEKLTKFPKSIVSILWNKELEALQNKQDLVRNKQNSDCCK